MFVSAWIKNAEWRTHNERIISGLLTAKLHVAQRKAAEGRRTPGRFARHQALEFASAFWGAQTLALYPHFSVFICALGAPSSNTTPSANSTRVVGPHA